MPLYIDPRGNPTFGIGICDRCRRKFPLHKLHDDPNQPGLKVCADDRDEIDRDRLPQMLRQEQPLPFTNPDTPIDPEPTMPIGIITENETSYMRDEFGNWIIP